MIQSDFDNVEGSETVGFSHGEFGLVVEALDHSAGELLLGSEIVENQFAVTSQGLGDLLHWLDARAHSLLTPLVEELGGPSRRVVFPELLEVFVEQVGSYGLEVVAQQVAQPKALGAGEIFLAL